MDAGVEVRHACAERTLLGGYYSSARTIIIGVGGLFKRGTSLLPFGTRARFALCRNRVFPQSSTVFGSLSLPLPRPPSPHPHVYASEWVFAFLVSYSGKHHFFAPFCLPRALNGACFGTPGNYLLGLQPLLFSPPRGGQERTAAGRERGERAYGRKGRGRKVPSGYPRPVRKSRHIRSLRARPCFGLSRE